MARHVVIRHDGEGQLVPEAPLPAEADLHLALTEFPELLPADDLGFGRTIVVGRESALASGYADLVLLDDRGRLCLVEVKRAGNPDTRRVAAQLLDYAAALWGSSLPDFERFKLTGRQDSLDATDPSLPHPPGGTSTLGSDAGRFPLAPPACSLALTGAGLPPARGCEPMFGSGHVQVQAP